MADISLYRTQEQIVAEMLAELQSYISDAYVGEDGTLRIIFEIDAGQLENAFLANQLVLQDMFVQTASYQALRQHGIQYGLSVKEGVRSSGTLLFEGAAGTYIGIGAEVAYDPGEGLEVLYFTTTSDGTIPNPGDPTTPTVAVDAAAGNLNGTYEYVVTFVTAEGETLPSPESATVNPANERVDLSDIPVGGLGTIARRIYRDKNGAGVFRRVVEIANNVDTVYEDNITDGAVAANPLVPTVDTAHRVELDAEAEEPGVEGNVAIGTITEITNASASLTSVTNPTAFTGGTDQEDTEAFRQRLLEYLRNPQTGSPGDLKSWAEAVPGVESATVFTNDNLGVATNGHVTVRISGPGGTIPGAPVIAAVLAALEDQDLANVTIHVATFVAVPTDVTADVTPAAGYVLADIEDSVIAAIEDYINALEVGETFYKSGVIAMVKPLPGVEDVTVTLPVANSLATNPTDKRTPGTILVV